MDGLHKNEEGTSKYSTAIEDLAEIQGLRSDEVESLYEAVLAELRRDAVIMDFLPIFAVRKVKEILYQKTAADREDDS